MKNLARSSEARQEPRPATETALPPAPICTRCGGPIGRYAFTVPTVDGDRHEFCPQPPPTETDVPEAIAPAVERIRWLAARPSNALCDHPACHSASANPCDEYYAAARAKGKR